jgi:Fungal protein kinase
MDFWIEVKPSKMYDPFNDPAGKKLPRTKTARKSFYCKSMEAQETQGQIVAYANAQWARQFRTRFFSMLICGQHVRIILWDRTCVIVTESFDYVQCPSNLTEFLWRYHLLSQDMRGFDTSVTTPNSDEVAAARDALQITDKDPTFVKVMVPQDKEPDAFYIAKSPSFCWQSPMGRGTRGFAAYDFTNDKVVWIKDYWRINAPEIEKEGDIYADLHRHNVPHIPKLERGGDITSSLLCITSHHRWKDEPWACRTLEMVTYSLYRIALGEVGRDLTSFASSWEYVNAIADAVEGKPAWRNMGISQYLKRYSSLGGLRSSQDTSS